MLMRHLFLDSIKTGDKTPILIPLRNINNTQHDLIELIAVTLNEMGFECSLSYVAEAIHLGHFVLLLDGLDEVPLQQRKKLAADISEIASRHADCPMIVSSRADDIFNSMRPFHAYTICPLSLDEACSLVEKRPAFPSQIKTHFITALRQGLFAAHHSFSSNPLLLTIMLLTYEETAEIPSNLSLFYQRAFEVMFYRHDAQKDLFRREMICGLDIQQFERVLAAFSLLTYDKKDLKWGITLTLEYIDKAGKLTSLADKFQSKDFLADALQAVCMFVEDGLDFSFTHRSFQEYFVAKFIVYADFQVQQKLIEKYSQYSHSDMVFSLLYKLNPSLVERSLLIPKLNELFAILEVQQEADISIVHLGRYVKMTYSHWRIEKNEINGISHVLIDRRGTSVSYSNYSFFLFTLFPVLLSRKHPAYVHDDIKQKLLKGASVREIELSTLSDDNEVFLPISQDFAHMSVEFLKGLFQIKEQLESKVRHERDSLGDILGIAT